MLLPRDLPLLAVFSSIARHASFTLAARELGSTKSVVSAQLRSLESKYGVRLIDRTTRSVRLTSVGVAAFAATQRMLEAARLVDEAVSVPRGDPSGRVRVGAPHGLGASVIAPVIAALVRDHPRLSIELVVDDNVQDLIRQELDVAIRIGVPRDSTYVMRRLGESMVILVASPLVALPNARRPSDLADAPWVRHVVVDRGPRFTFTGTGERKDSVRPRVRAAANTMEAFRSLLTSGAGVGAIPELHVADDLRRGTLVHVCPGWVKRRVVVYGLTASKETLARHEVLLNALRAGLVRAGLGLMRRS
jgi:DNA-binding transcriptional LysR family regulator